MRTLLASMMVGLAIVPPALGHGDEPTDSRRQTDPTLLVQGNNQLALELHDRLPSRDGDLCFAPISVATTFALLYAGARSYTADEMADVLHLPPNHDSLQRMVAALLRELRAEQVFATTKLWQQPGHVLREEFLTAARTGYGVGPEYLRFDAADTESRRMINAWVAERASGRIRELLPTGTINGRTGLVLTSTVHVREPWANPPAIDGTRSSRFRTAADHQTEVPMMHMRGRFGYQESGACQVLELPCAGRSVSLVLFLPHRVNSLAELVKSFRLDEEEGKEGKRGDAKDSKERLHFSQLADGLGRLKEIEVEVTLPRFVATADPDLARPLQRMGMERAFLWGAADFTGRGERGEGVFIAGLRHQAVVRVSEAGLEADAATAVAMEPKRGCQLLGLKVRMAKAQQALSKWGGPADRTAVIHVDRPFLFLIRDTRTGSILFVGRVTHPDK